MSDEMHAPPKPRFDPTINWGHLLMAVSLMAAATGTYYGIKSDMRAMETRVLSIERTTEKVSLAIDRITAVLVTDARQDVVIEGLSRRVEIVERKVEALERRPTR